MDRDAKPGVRPRDHGNRLDGRSESKMQGLFAESETRPPYCSQWPLRQEQRLKESRVVSTSSSYHEVN